MSDYNALFSVSHSEPPVRESTLDTFETPTFETPTPEESATNKAASAREARRQARKELLEQMESEGKLKQSEEGKRSASPPSQASDGLEITTKAEADGKRRQRRQKVWPLWNYFSILHATSVLGYFVCILNDIVYYFFRYICYST